MPRLYLFIYLCFTLRQPLVICARKRNSLGGGGERMVEEKSLQIINNSGFAIDNFSWDFPGEPISASCWGGFGHINFCANVHLCYTYLWWSDKAFVNEVYDQTFHSSRESC